MRLINVKDLSLFCYIQILQELERNVLYAFMYHVHVLVHSETQNKHRKIVRICSALWGNEKFSHLDHLSSE